MRFTAEYLRSRFTYYPESGYLTFKARIGNDHQTNSWNSNNAGKVAGSISTNAAGKRYWCVGLDGKKIMAHTVIWMMHHGYKPKEIDHIDGNGRNNLIENLREVSSVENSRNRRRYISNTSGVTGVRKPKILGKWVAAIKIDSKSIYLGSYAVFFEAVCARKRAELKYGFHENHGSDRPL